MTFKVYVMGFEPYDMWVGSLDELFTLVREYSRMETFVVDLKNMTITIE